ncbi:MAG: ATP-binding protein [Ignavibacteriaceae bacterium]|nr:ATP-binding protein [Ignavibacteriaceae bacterium]
MIQSIKLRNCGPIKSIDWDQLGDINVIIGENSSGKTLLLKALYALVKSLEDYQRGDDSKTYKEVINEKLKWTFQLDRLGNLVTKGEKEKFKLEIDIDDRQALISFGANADKGVGEVLENVKRRDNNSVFIPAKEVISLANVIKSSRGIEKQFGFDDTYYDLILALEKNPTQGKIAQNFLSAFKDLKTITKGDIDYFEGKWSYKNGNEKFNIYLVAEGYKKIAILERLIRNRTLNKGSILFVDEPEVFLHPQAEIKFVEMLHKLSCQGIQIFIATHSYFVIKKLILLSKINNSSIPIISLGLESQISYDNLRTGFPDNSIIDVAISLYDEEVKIG